MKRYWNTLKNDRKGQGTTEYVVILALVIGMLVVFFPNIKTAITNESAKIVTMINDSSK